MPFVHLHNHTHYSLLDGLTKIDELVNLAKEDGAPAVAITDHGVMYGAIEFYQKCKKAGIKPIIGVEAYLAPGSRHDKNTRADGRSYHLLLLARNNDGYRNLIKLTSLAHLEGFYYKPRIDWELLQEHHEGLIACSACLGGEIPQLILSDKIEQAKKRILEYQELFGVGNYYLEIMDHPELAGMTMVNNKLIEISKELGVPVVATNDIHYLKKDDDEAQDILLCIQNKKKKTDTDRMSMMGGNYSYRLAKEMESVFAHVPEAIENTLKIAEKCNVEIDLGNIQLPHFEVPAGYDGNSYLRFLCEEGIKKRYIQKLSSEEEKTVRERMDYELSVVEKMGWPAYFLIVADFVNWAKDQGIVVGPGRGSAAGSIVCYLTGITNLDPIKYDLLFERFLNPERISMPDIDMDFADTRRGEVLEYVANKYGADHVAQIITFGTMASRAAVRDAGRVLGEPYELCDRISKAIPAKFDISGSIKSVPEFREIYENDLAAKRVVDYAKRLEGVARHSSTHACGVLITDKPLTEYVPIQYASSADKSIISQYSLHPVEDLGLLKMDFLGLKNLTIIESALRIIKNTRGLNVDIDQIPLDDVATFELFQRGETTGVFQFESSGMKRYLRDLKPTVFEDIIAMVALYRPGPMEWIPDYISGKHKIKQVVYLHPKLEPILDKTYGVAIYQEQVMQIARDLAGFTMGQADVLRKAMGKKIPALLAEQKEKFIEGCVKNGIHLELGQKVFSFIEPFAGYGFNRSHAACYAMIGYQTAYLKAHWPVEFMAALLTSDQHDTDRIAIEIDECKNMGMRIMAPDVNESFASFTVVTPGTAKNEVVPENEKIETIRFGLNAVKNVGEHIVEVIIAERKAAGPFKSLLEFLERITDKDLNKKSLESLIKCGALDSYGERGQLLFNLEKILSVNKESSKRRESRQSSLFGALPNTDALRLTLEPGKPIDKSEQLSWEKELLGLYISEHPFSIFRNYFGDYSIPLKMLNSRVNDEMVVTAGVVTSIKKIITKSGETMMFVKIEDVSGNGEILVFPSVLKANPDLWKDGVMLGVYGRLSDKDGEMKILASVAIALDLSNPQTSVDEVKRAVMNYKANAPKNNYRNRGNYTRAENITKPQVVIAKPESHEDPKKINNPLKIILLQELSPAETEIMKSEMSAHSGGDPVYFKINIKGKDQIIKSGFFVDNCETLKNELIVALKDKIKIVAV
ncbi:MAG: DNA polymerase III subunit alpha [Candidatus Falkowbacteria bacterium]|nr:DNA polymerase III subunit alpha [Candidatus Falkowbacteria bacterium]